VAVGAPAAARVLLVRRGNRNLRILSATREPMPLTSTDWIVIVGYLLANLLIGVYYRQRASGNTEEFFISGRDVSWWLAGTSMVATTFAADTPLLVCGLVARQGIAGNWIWWG
jgi:SSS family solute:Na+ symporter